MTIYTIGFSKKNLRQFIKIIQFAGVKKIIDVRLHNTSQLAGYAKKDDLDYVLSLVGIKYEHHPELAPTEDILNDYKKKKIKWDEYEKRFNKLLTVRNPVIDKLNIESGPVCLLCAEDKATQCHRRLVAEYIVSNNQEVQIKHL